MAWTTDLKERMATREDRILTFVTALLLVVFGYVAGLWTAETKQAPILFQSGSAGQNALLSDDDLATLAEGIPSPSTTPKTLTTTALSATTETNTTPDDALPAVQADTTAPADGQFVASANGTKYYFPDCAEVKRIKPENIVTYTTEQEALGAGLEASSCVKKRRGQ